MNGTVLFLIGEKVGVPGSTTMILHHPRASSASERRGVVGVVGGWWVGGVVRLAKVAIFELDV